MGVGVVIRVRVRVSVRVRVRVRARLTTYGSRRSITKFGVGVRIRDGVIGL